MKVFIIEISQGFQIELVENKTLSNSCDSQAGR